eukprot:3045053-Prymnesium_polylepis.1
MAAAAMPRKTWPRRDGVRRHAGRHGAPLGQAGTYPLVGGCAQTTSKPRKKRSEPIGGAGHPPLWEMPSVG